MDTTTTRDEHPRDRGAVNGAGDRLSEEWFRHLADAMPQLVWTADPDGTVDYYNQRVHEFAGIHFEKGAWAWAPVLHPDDVQPTVDAWTEALRTGTMYEVGHRVRRADGSFRWYLSRGTPLLDEAGQVVKWYGTATDIHQQKETEEALLTIQERYDLVSRATNDVMWEWDMATDTVAWNGAITTVFGHAPTTIDTSSSWWIRHIHPDDREVVTSSIRAVIDGLEEGWSCSYRFLRGDGTYASVLDRGYMARKADGRAVRMIGSMLDLTERMRMEDELRERARALAAADRAKDEFIAMLGHELRNPLSAIANATELLRRRVSDKPSCKRPLDILSRQVGHMTRQVDDLLDVSRVTLGKLELRKEPTDLVFILDRALEGVRPLCYASRHALSVERPDEPLPLVGDPARLEQVVSNLLSNAAKYTEPGGRIEVTARRDGDEAVVEVRDNGMGIRPEEVSGIFGMFAQEERTLDRSKGGLGIGLTLVKYLVEMHGGCVAAHSDGPGRGSTFTVRLPLSAGPVPLAEQKEPGSVADARPLRILLVEDNLDAAEAMSGILEVWGHSVRTVSTGPAALAAVAESLPDVVLLDIGLPEMDGLAVARRLREEHDGRPLVLIALSGYGQAEDRRRAADAGFDHYLVKPADIAALSEILSLSSSSR